MPDYYGTGRQPKKKRSYVWLAIVLSVVLLVLCAAPFVIPFLLQRQEPWDRSVPPDGSVSVGERSFMLPPEDGGPQPPQQTVVCGMLIYELDDVQQRYWNLPNGVIVGQVDKDGAAAKAGILAGDVIVRIGDTTPCSAADCRTLLASYKDGEQVQIELHRSGEQFRVTLTCSVE